MDLKMSSEERQKGQVAELPLLEHMQERKQEQGHDGTQAGFVTVGLEGPPEQARPSPLASAWPQAAWLSWEGRASGAQSVFLQGTSLFTLVML